MKVCIAPDPRVPRFTDDTAIRVVPYAGDHHAIQAAAAIRPSLGFPALGILAFLLTCGPFPPTFRVRDLVAASPDGPAVVRPALRELYAAGYLTVPTTGIGAGSAEVLVRRWPMAALTGGTRGGNAR